MHIDPLESRTHFAATVVRTGNILTIIGTNAADEISIAAGKTKFSVFANGRQWNVWTRFVKSVRINGFDGEDKILVSPRFNRSCNISAGAGDDLVSGGSLSDSIWGYQGNDTINGNNGNDYLDGGEGDDVLYDYHPANDNFEEQNVLHGGTGNDIGYGAPQNFVSGIESMSPTFATGKVIRRGSKILLVITRDIGNDDVTSLTFQRLTKNTAGDFVVEYTISDSYFSTGPKLASLEIDITAAKGSRVSIYQDHWYFDVESHFSGAGPNRFLLFDKL